jgi:hypothetical protein
VCLHCSNLRTHMSRSDDKLEQWRRRAAELRALADTMTDAVTKRLMGELAACYDQLAERSEHRNNK